jgi:23S rRNA pseudouridine955/2504/2580 synthase
MTPDRNSGGGVRKVPAGAAGEGQRLDNFLLRVLAGVPRSRVYRLLRRGEVRVNGRRKGPEYRLAADDEVRLPPVRSADAAGRATGRVPAPLLSLVGAALIHEDERLLVLNKPPGLAVHGGSGLAFGAIEALRALRPGEQLELAHRLDRDTSGCLLVARTRVALRLLHALLREGRVEKHYAALVTGRWRLGRKTIDAPVLTRQRQGGQRVVRVHAAGKLAITDFAPRERFGDLATLMHVTIRTGRTHQIRVHAAFAGHPVAGDDKYGERAANALLAEIGLRRLFLHAAEVAFVWPDTGTRFRAQAPLPDDLEVVLEALRQRAPARR